MKESNSSLRTINSDSVLQLSPTNFIRGGYYDYNSGDARNGYGNYWQNQTTSITNVRFLYFYSNYFGPNGNSTYYKGNGFTIRCLVR